MSSPRSRKPKVTPSIGPDSRTPKPSRKVAESARWYDETHARHVHAAEAIATLLGTVLRAQGIDVHDIRKRVKTRESFLRKAARQKYREPWKEIQDVIGIRVITYFESAARRASEIVEHEFDVDRANSLDKSESLGTDRVGYRSVHYIARIAPHRRSLPEYAALDGICFEIQVRSVLQHAWAEIEHDRRFKHDGPLPAALSRRFSVLAGVLELADREFDEIVRELDGLAAAAAAAAVAAHASRPLEVANIADYLGRLFEAHLRTGLVEKGFGGGGGAEALDELQAFGVATLADLVALVPPDFETKYPESFEDQTTFGGILRHAMMARDGRRYFDRAYKQTWNVVDGPTLAILASQGIGVEELRSKYGLLTESDLRDGDEDDEDCAFCGRRVPFGELQPIGAGGQDAPLMCRRCVSENDAEARDW